MSFRSAESRFSPIDSREKLLVFLDDEIIDALSYHVRDEWVILPRTSQKIEITKFFIKFLTSSRGLKSLSGRW
ncbi:MAG: hypothetical protein GY801_37115 [bacterium]|nr:hypothetical protein [bacterium]